MTPSEPAPVFHPLWAHDLQTGAGDVAWLWHGFLAPGMTTLLTSQWKTGKTTLAAALLARLKVGGPFAGLDLRPGKAVVITEESSGHWFQRNRTLAFGDQVCWFCRPFVGRPQPSQWQALLDTVLALHARHHFDLVLVDPLSPFLPAGAENSAPAMLDFLLTLQRWTAAGLAVWLQHHPRKGRVLEGQAARGSGALPGFVDVLLEMSACQRGDPADRRRRLVAYSRFDATPRRLVLELNAAGTDYINHGDFEADDFQENWKHVRIILQDGGGKLTRRQIRDGWPPDYPAPDPSTLWRWLDRAAGLGLVRQEGLGSRAFPFHYWLPEREKDELFHYLSQTGRVAQEYRLLLAELGHLPPFEDVPAADRARAQRRAAAKVFGEAAPPLVNLFGAAAVAEAPAVSPASASREGSPAGPPPDADSLVLGPPLEDISSGPVTTPNTTPEAPSLQKPAPPGWPWSLLEPHQPPA